MFCKSIFYRVTPTIINEIGGRFPFLRAFGMRSQSKKLSGPFITVPEDKINIDINRYKAVGGMPFSIQCSFLGNALPNDITSRVRVMFNIDEAEWMPESELHHTFHI